ncbi:hypothetical protein A2U01_0047654, partial [Trifolium medium]|nr:hypothetical protein [Trifolium medium]
PSESKFSAVNDVLEEVVSKSSLTGYSVTAGNKVAEKWVWFQEKVLELI